jgi:MFS family permease
MIASPLSVRLMANFSTPTHLGIAETFLVLGAGYFVFMMIGAALVRVPGPGFKPAAAPAPRKLVSTHDVYVYDALKTPQFWLLWGVLCMNVSAGIGVLGQASAMSQEIFPGRVTVVAAAGFVGLLSLFNMVGRFFWASTSDLIGRRNTYFCFFLLGIVLYALVPYAGSIGSVALFVACCAVILSMYGGGFATIPAYLRDLFGTRYVGAIHGMLITAWSVAGVLGPVLVNYIRQYQIDHGVVKAQAYDFTLYIMAGLLVVGLICNALVKPVDERFHMKADPLERSAAGSGAMDPALNTAAAGSSTSPAVLALAWAVVGVPLLWAVYETMLNAMKLFK